MKGSAQADDGRDAALSIGILGPLHVVVGGTAAAITRPQAQVVLARLALARGQVIEVDELIDAVWGESPPESARKILQKYVSELRRRVGGGHLRTEQSGYAVDGAEVDATRFEELLDAARSAQMQDRLRRAWELIEEGLGLWRGRALAGLPDVALLNDEAARLEELKLGAIEEQMEIGLALGKHEALVAPLQDLVAKHPLRERLWASLMTSLYRTGRQVDALSAYRRLRSHLQEELGIEPSPDLAALEERILAHDRDLQTTQTSDSLGNMPATFTSFVGRADELDRLVLLLVKDRLVTIVGPGGAGKTRLALEVASALQSTRADGAWFVDLAALTDPSLLPMVTATALGITPEPEVALERTLLNYLATKRMTMVLDNCEHLIDAAAAFAASVVRTARGVTILATSRAPLGLAGEVIFRLDPLAIPEKDATGQAVTDVASVRLFVDRASAADPGFAVTAEVAPRIADICRRLEGIPLAIELAARQLHVIGPDELYESLLDRLGVLDAPGEPDERHRTMEAAIDWSFQLLDEHLQRFFKVLSVFPGSFTANAAEAVCRHAGVELERGAVSALAALVSRSMVVRSTSGELPRFRLLQPIRSFARALTATDGTDGVLCRAHALWVRDLVGEHPEILGPDEAYLIGLLVQEHHHLPTALRWAADHEPDLAVEILENAADLISMEEYRMTWAGDIFTALASSETAKLSAVAIANGAFALTDRFDYPTAYGWAKAATVAADASGEQHLIVRARLALSSAARSRGKLGESREILVGLLEMVDQPGQERWAARARIILTHAELGFGNYDAAVKVSDEAARLWERVGSKWGQGKSHWLLAAAHAMRGDHEEAEIHARRARELMQEYDNPSPLVHLRAVEGDAARLIGDLERAQDIYRECLGGFQAIGDRRCTASSLKNLGVVAVQLGRPEEAQHLLIAALDRRRRLGDETGFAECLEGLALAARQTGGNAIAVGLLAAASRLRARIGVAAPPVERAAVEELTSDLRAAVPEDVFEGAWAEGLDLAIEDVFAYVNRSPSATVGG